VTFTEDLKQDAGNTNRFKDDLRSLVRMGDVLSAALVLAGTSLLILPSRGFAFVNAALAVVALILAWRVGRYYKTLTASSTTAAAA